jgi:hypothetical protein
MAMIEIPDSIAELITVTDTRAPNAKDTGFFWFHLNGANVDMYVKHSLAGAWKGPTSFT